MMKRTAVLAALVAAMALPMQAEPAGAASGKATATTTEPAKPAGDEKSIGVAPVVGSTGTLGVPPPTAGLLPSAEDLIKSGRALNDDSEGDLAFGAFQRGLYLTAFQIAMSRAQRGDAASSTLVGRLYAEGLGVKPAELVAARIRLEQA